MRVDSNPRNVGSVFSKARNFGSRPASVASVVPLAWRNLNADKTRLVRAISGISFAVLLIMIQLGFREAFLDSALAIIRNIDGDIFISSATKFRFGRKDAFSYRMIYAARAAQDIDWVRPMYGEWLTSSWKNPATGKLYNVQVLAFDPLQPVFLFPEVADNLEALRQADTALLDRRARRFVGEGGAGMVTELARRQLRIVGSFSLGPDFTTDGTIIVSDWTFRKFFPPPDGSSTDRNDVEFGVVKVRDGRSVEDVKVALRRILPPALAVRTRAEQIALEVAFQNEVSPVGPIFLLGTLIGFIVGLMISYQILYTELSDQEVQYATLKAIGYDNAYLMRTVLMQSAFYGLVGFVPAFLAGIVVFRLIGETALLPMRLNFAICLVSIALTLGMCVTAGWLAAKRVLKADPAEIF